ncbi:hypothetical protein NMG60_11005378 [Bertholletia excelsa]
MEFKLSSIEKAERIVWSSDDHQGSSHGKFFTCTFCKRAFSNAQALGGHMNIHRRDRAKLRESSDDQSAVFEETTGKIDPSNHPNPSADEDNSQLQLREEKSCTHKRPWTFSREERDVSKVKDGDGEPRQLHLFVNSPLASGDPEDTSYESDRVEKSKGLGQSSSSHEELDLELRLGLEHHGSSISGTKEFF